MKKSKIEYQAEINKTQNGNYHYYVIFHDVANRINKVEVTKIVFLQFFGTHKIEIIDNVKHYYIVYKEDCMIELNSQEYKKFMSFKSEEVRTNNINSRYIEHSELTEVTLHKRLLNKQCNITEIIHKKNIIKKLYLAISSLNKIQQKRLIMYYFDDMTYEQIAKAEHCSKSAVKFSIDIAKDHLKKELTKFKILD
ncbi:MAG: sigma-70 region 4 domain-containing protein [Bacilli bacterium]